MRQNDPFEPLFSEREGFQSTSTEIGVRRDAPQALREALPQLVYALGWTPTRLRRVVCRTLLVAPDRDSWTDYPNVADEVDYLIGSCDWFRVYDVVEALAREFEQSSGARDRYEDRLNLLFRERGIGWKLEGTSLVHRGDEIFQETLSSAEETLKADGLRQSALRLREALKDLSRRPEPDAPGAVTHAIAALEATARELDGRHHKTLGKLIQALPLPDEFGKALQALWRFSSSHARHGNEGQVVDLEQAELVVAVAAAVCTFLCRTHSKKPGPRGGAV